MAMTPPVKSGSSSIEGKARRLAGTIKNMRRMHTILAIYI
jgi:hypothetical protein